MIYICQSFYLLSISISRNGKRRDAVRDFVFAHSPWVQCGIEQWMVHSAPSARANHGLNSQDFWVANVWKKTLGSVYIKNAWGNCTSHSKFLAATAWVIGLRAYYPGVSQFSVIGLMACRVVDSEFLQQLLSVRQLMCRVIGLRACHPGIRGSCWACCGLMLLLVLRDWASGLSRRRSWASTGHGLRRSVVIGLRACCVCPRAFTISLLVQGVYSVQLHGGVPVGPPIPSKLSEYHRAAGPDGARLRLSRAAGPVQIERKDWSFLTGFFGSPVEREVAM